MKICIITVTGMFKIKESCVMSGIGMGMSGSMDLIADGMLG
jgi:hypothetical protein